MTISSAIFAALSNVFGGKDATDAKAALAAGSTDTVDCTIIDNRTGKVFTVKGSVAKASKGTMVADTTSLPTSTVMALAFHSAGFHAERLEALCGKILRGDLTDAERATMEKFDADWDRIKATLPKRENSPAVKVKATLEEVQGEDAIRVTA